MVSLSDKAEKKMRSEIERLYHGRVGGLSIFFETLIREYFEKEENAGTT